MNNTKRRSVKGFIFTIMFTMTAFTAAVPVAAGTPASPRAVATAETYVWKTETGKCYHSKNNCGKTNPKKATKITLSEAKAKGLKKCSKCWK